MNADDQFEQLTEKEQNKMLKRVAAQLRPMLGEIGEVLVKEKRFKVDNEEVNKKPGFIGILFPLGNKKVIAFAEFVHEEDRKRYRETEKATADTHIFLLENNYINNLRVTVSTPQEYSAPIKLAPFNDSTLTEIFRIAYGEEAKNTRFKIRFFGKHLGNNNKEDIEVLLYFATKSGDISAINHSALKSSPVWIAQLIRNALGLAGISEPSLRLAVRYLSAKLPQRFNDYVLPQTLAAIYAYVREVVPFSSPWESIHTPTVTGTDGEVADKLKSIHKAERVELNRAVDGSVKRAAVYSIQVTTERSDTEIKTQYPAIAKFSTVKEARAEAEGLRRMQRYYSRIGKMLPPPLEVYLLTKYDESTSRRTPPLEPTKDWMDTPCISVTPDLEGSILAEKIASLWALPTRRVEKFTGFLGQARTFIREIQRQPFIESGEAGANLSAGTHRPHDLLIEFFEKEFKFPAQKERYTSLLDAFNSNFPFSTWLKLGSIVEAKLVNPHVWLKKMIESPNSIVWQNHHQRSKRFVLKHGDFHAGNLFYTSEGDNLVVLDYDRVGGGLPEEDLACLDASFVSAVFGLSDFDLQSNWEKYALESIALLSWIHPSTIDCHCNNSFARELFETLSILRPGTICPFYAASVVKALVGQLRARCVPWNDQKKKYESVDAATLNKLRARNASAWLYMAMMLSHLVMPDSSDPEDFHPY